MQNRTLALLIQKYAANSYKIETTLTTIATNQFSLTTPHLNLSPCTLNDLADYQCMVSDPATMALYANGNPWEKTYTAYRLLQWESLWQQNIPFSAFKILDHEAKFVGHIALDYDAETPAGCAEVSYIIKKEDWHKGYGSEATWAITHTYANALHDLPASQGLAFKGIYATARPDNPGSLSVLLKSKFSCEQKDGMAKETQWGTRYTFFKPVSVQINQETNGTVAALKF